MKERIKLLIATAVGVAMTAIPVLAPVSVHAQNIEGSLQCGTELQFTESGGECAAPAVDATTKVNELVELVINIFSVIVGIVAVIMIIFGGFKYITSGGDSSSVTGAKNTILYAIIGLVVVAMAQFIVRFVLQRVTQTSSTA
jgi:hypothetical protein